MLTLQSDRAIILWVKTGDELEERSLAPPEKKKSFQAVRGYYMCSCRDTAEKFFFFMN